jgi:hypothetical protein
MRGCVRATNEGLTTMIIEFDSSEEMTFRALLVLREDVITMCNTVEGVRLQCNALFERHGLSPCSPGSPS